MGAALLEGIGHNLTTSQLAEHYQGFKEMFGGDVADAVFNDYKEKYNNSLPIQALQSIDGQGVNYQPVTQKAILDKFDSKIEEWLMIHISTQIAELYINRKQISIVKWQKP